MNSQNQLPVPAEVCPHTFIRDGQPLPHYCTYVRPMMLSNHVFRKGKTPDERCILAYLATCTLWSSLLSQELSAVELAQTGLLTQTRYQSIMKRLKRCIVVVEVLQAQSQLLRRHILSQRSLAVSFQIGSSPDDTLFHGIVVAIEQLLKSQSHFSFQEGEGVLEKDYLLLLDQLRLTLLQLQEQIGPPILCFEEIISLLRAPTARGEIVHDLINTTFLLDLPGRIVQAYHPNASRRGSYDELTFLLAHQCSEVWMGAAIMTISTAITAVDLNHMAQACVFIERISDIMHLFASMIQIPQTMSAPDYLRFRQELKGGSGAESYQFRRLELLMGIEDERYFSHLQRFDLLTPDHQRDIENRHSLHQAFLRLLARRGIISSPEEEPESIASSLSREVYRYTGLPHVHADLQELSEALLSLEEEVIRWRQVHLLMVDRLIGGQRQSFGIGKQAGRSEGKRSYLVQTQAYQPLFPALWLVRKMLQEEVVIDD